MSQNLHQTICDLMVSMGYDGSSLLGVCHGLTGMALQAVLAEDMEQFNLRIELLNKLSDKIVPWYLLLDRHGTKKLTLLSPILDRIQQAKDNIVKTKHVAELKYDKSLNDILSQNQPLEVIEASLTEGERRTLDKFILDLKAFFDGVILYQDPTIFEDNTIFKKAPEEQSFDHAMPILTPVKLSDQSDKIQSLSDETFCGKYTVEELTTKYLKPLKEAWKTESPDAKAVFKAGSFGHSICFTYDPKEDCWTLIDANHLPIKKFKDEKSMADAIQNQLSTFGTLLFETKVLSTQKHKEAFQKTLRSWKNSPDWISLHLMKPLNELNSNQSSIEEKHTPLAPYVEILKFKSKNKINVALGFRKNETTIYNKYKKSREILESLKFKFSKKNISDDNADNENHIIAVEKSASEKEAFYANHYYNVVIKREFEAFDMLANFLLYDSANGIENEMIKIYKMIEGKMKDNQQVLNVINKIKLKINELNKGSIVVTIDNLRNPDFQYLNFIKPMADIVFTIENSHQAEEIKNQLNDANLFPRFGKEITKQIDRLTKLKSRLIPEEKKNDPLETHSDVRYQDLILHIFSLAKPLYEKNHPNFIDSLSRNDIELFHTYFLSPKNFYVLINYFVPDFLNSPNTSDVDLCIIRDLLVNREKWNYFYGCDFLEFISSGEKIPDETKPAFEKIRLALKHTDKMSLLLYYIEQAWLQCKQDVENIPKDNDTRTFFSSIESELQLIKTSPSLASTIMIMENLAEKIQKQLDVDNQQASSPLLFKNSTAALKPLGEFSDLLKKTLNEIKPLPALKR